VRSKCGGSARPALEVEVDIAQVAGVELLPVAAVKLIALRREAAKVLLGMSMVRSCKAGARWVQSLSRRHLIVAE